MPRQNRHSTEFSGVYFVKLVNEINRFLSVTNAMEKVLKKGRDAVMRAGTQKKPGICAQKEYPE